ncbi:MULTISPECIES: ATP-binding cassette domain-containing protein [Saccharothrix]|uniref:ATP-binding cassette domain-containing protein n=1 Tax=Saccharothrix TaxID=2071 RepID=UPI00095DC358|nr:ATP-binding cassette domain-containing protein [Saccharothrix sp. CB00851]OKI18664.1 hypothetical protein A6A25_39640 [Saccharothrix sp. CB00851]
MTHSISVEDVRYGYDRNRPVLNGLSFALPGGLHFLLGVNGAGKTTLFRLLLGALQPAAGRISVQRSAESGVDAVGYLPQAFDFPGHVTVRQFVRYVGWLRGMRKTDAAATRAIGLVGLAERADVPLKKLSGGMLRRAGIAQAIVHEPAVLLLDEPTSGLDPAQRVDLRALLTGLAESMCVLVSTHLMEDAQYAGGDVLILHDGAIRFQGATTEVEIGDQDSGTTGLSPLEQYFLRITRA